jgi:uncharacterized protein DUF4430
VSRAACGLLVVALVLAGCGGGERTHGTATLWVTRDRGAHVVFRGEVPAGLTAMQALDRELDVTTRYGGRFVQSISGVEGSVTSERDWFYFVNGIEADRSAAEVRLRPGDVEWWDYRSWSRQMSVPVVVGAFPEPFLHGYDGKVGPAIVSYVRPGDAAGARAVARLLRGRVLPRGAVPPRDANLFRIGAGPPHLTARRLSGGGVEFDFAGDALRLARHPGSVRYRYRVP